MSDERIYDRAQIAFQKLSPQPNDILVIKFPDDIVHEQMAAFAQGIQQHVPDDVIVLCTRAGMSIDLFNEEQMNQLGWYRKGEDK